MPVIGIKCSAIVRLPGQVLNKCLYWLSRGANTGLLHMGMSYCTSFLPNSGTAQSSIVFSAVSVNTLTAHILLVTCLAMYFLNNH